MTILNDAVGSFLIDASWLCIHFLSSTLLSVRLINFVGEEVLFNTTLLMLILIFEFLLWGLVEFGIVLE
jgi:hypothetical protein